MPFGDVLYLDCAARAPMLRGVHAAARLALEANAAPWTQSFDALEAQVEAVRALAAGLLDGDAEAVAPVPSAAFALSTAARNLPLAAGEAVLLLEGQFPSNLLPWQQRCAETGARIAAVRRAPGQGWTNAVLAALDAEPRVRVVALPQVRWDDGALLDLDRIAPRVHAAGAALVLDLSQSLGALPAGIARWQPDFVASVGYKWLLGPRGLSWLWAASRWREAGVAIEQHWSARDAGDGWRFPVEAPPPPRRGARRFDAGGLDEPLPLAMAAAGLEQVLAWGVPDIATALGKCTRALDDALDAHGLSAWKTPGHAPHLTALRPPAERLDAVFDALRRERIICTRRHGLLRIAPHLHVTPEDMSRVAAVAARAA
ncbi:aminotransferase class V-fold PLP-dependent enzyme [Luteimonas soli]|uniref:Aminotransferase class V-fold PLP-dependent enzyme n=1 Tax=Luteimonas soli TaxID=1648966 RepID=A0ABV7XMH0_9GAMM